MTTVLRALVLAAVLIPSAVAQQAQEESRPIERENLIEALKTGSLPEDKAIEVIARRKLNFAMTAEYEKEFRDLKAGEALINALWKNDAFQVNPGKPLTKDAIITLLETGVPSPRLEKIVEVRKAVLVLDPAVSKGIRDAGGSQSLLGVILTNLVVAKPDETQTEDIGKKYSELMRQAEDKVKAGDYGQATALADRAKELDSNDPEAYSFSGYVWLYYRDHIPTARTEYSRALEKGGTISFRVRHSDGVSKITRRHETCAGTMRITRNNVRYEADNRQHIIEFTRDQVRRVERGSLPGPLGGGVVVMINQGMNKPQKELFFAARAKDKKEEEELIIDMIKE